MPYGSGLISSHSQRRPLGRLHPWTTRKCERLLSQGSWWLVVGVKRHVADEHFNDVLVDPGHVLVLTIEMRIKSVVASDMLFKLLPPLRMIEGIVLGKSFRKLCQLIFLHVDCTERNGKELNILGEGKFMWAGIILSLPNFHTKQTAGRHHLRRGTISFTWHYTVLRAMLGRMKRCFKRLGHCG